MKPCELRAEAVKNLSAASGLAYVRLGAILAFLAAPNPAPMQARDRNGRARRIVRIRITALFGTREHLDNLDQWRLIVPKKRSSSKTFVG